MQLSVADFDRNKHERPQGYIAFVGGEFVYYDNFSDVPKGVPYYKLEYAYQLSSALEALQNNAVYNAVVECRKALDVFSGSQYVLDDDGYNIKKEPVVTGCMAVGHAVHTSDGYRTFITQTLFAIQWSTATITMIVPNVGITTQPIVVIPEVEIVD